MPIRNRQCHVSDFDLLLFIGKITEKCTNHFIENKLDKSENQKQSNRYYFEVT